MYGSAGQQNLLHISVSALKQCRWYVNTLGDSWGTKS